ncbi:MAG TPA: arylesterase [Thiohalobacter sp.]|nr:arylesterase [Thiohalobacter sp.]
MRLLKLLLCVPLVAAAPARAEAPRILVLGDSISAAYGMELEQGWVHLLQQRLHLEGYPHRVVNASVSGETTAGGLARLPDLLQTHAPDVVILELGGNDGLRGLAMRETRANLARMISLSRQEDARVVLLGMKLPPNYGAVYTGAFERIFVELGARPGVTGVPFLLDGVALEPGLMQADGIHPTSRAQPQLLDNVWPALLHQLERRQDPVLHSSGD